MIDTRTTLIGNDRQKNNTNCNEDTRTLLIGNDRHKNNTNR